MSTAATTDAMREDIADWIEEKLKKGEGMMAFGSGAVDEQGKVMAADKTALKLIDEQGRFALHDWKRTAPAIIRVVGRLAPGAIVGTAISQAGFFVDGRLYAVRNFYEKTFEADEYFDVQIDVKF